MNRGRKRADVGDGPKTKSYLWRELIIVSNVDIEEAKEHTNYDHFVVRFVWLSGGAVAR